jgi:hypothetical protein
MDREAKNDATTCPVGYERSVEDNHVICTVPIELYKEPYPYPGFANNGYGFPRFPVEPIESE